MQKMIKRIGSVGMYNPIPPVLTASMLNDNGVQNTTSKKRYSNLKTMKYRTRSTNGNKQK